MMRYLFRLNVVKGTASKADAIGYRVGGKTGTAEKVINGRYSKNHRLTSFIGAFPMEAPRYVAAASCSTIRRRRRRPSATRRRAGTRCRPAGKVIARIAPLLGIAPILTAEDRKKLEKQASRRSPRGED